MTVLAELEPLDPSTGERVLLRVANTADTDAAGWNDEIWYPAMRAAPKLSVSLFDAEFDGKASTSADKLVLALDGLAMANPDVSRMVWPRAPITLHRHDGSTAAPVFRGLVENFSVDGQVLTLSLRVNDEPFGVSVLSADYDGNGGAEGAADLKGRPKPWLFGRAVNVEPVLINGVDSVYQVSAYGPVQAITACYERGASFGAAASDHANYAALVAAALQPGQWATCLAQGMIRLGAPAVGVITLDADGDNVEGFVRATGEILGRIAAHVGALSSLAGSTLAALDAAVPRNIALYLTEQTTLLALAQRLAAPCNAAAGVNLLGKLFVSRIAFGDSVLMLDAQARQLPAVNFIGEEPVHAPYKRIMLGAARTWRVHGFDEIAFAAPLFERGIYDPATIYYEGNIVTTGNGSRWLFIATTGVAGVTPGSNPAVWSQLGAANALNARGPYLIGATYAVGDIAFWRISDGGDGNSYVRIGEGETTGVDPDDATKWELFIEGGVPGTPGVDGTSPPLITIEATQQVARFNSDGIYLGGPITFNVHRENIPSGAVWGFKITRISDELLLSATTAAGYVAADPVKFSSSDASSLTMTAAGVAAYFALHGPFRITAYADGYDASASVPITYFSDGDDGVDGEDGYWRERVYKVSATQPATPTGPGIPSGWTDDPTAAVGEIEWESWSKQELDGTLAPGASWSTPVIRTGQKGADAITFSPASVAWNIASSQNGTPNAGELPRSVTFKVMQGATDISDSADTDYVLTTPGGYAGSMGGTNGKVFTATSISGDTATATVTIQRFGVTVGVVEIKMDKQRAGAAATQFSENVTALAASGTYAVSNDFDINVPAGAVLSAEAAVFYLAASGSYRSQIKVTYENITDGGTETDLTSGIADFQAPSGESGEAYAPSAAYSPGHATAKLYRIRLYTRRASGTGAASSVSGALYARAG